MFVVSLRNVIMDFGISLLGYVYMGPDQNHSEPNATGSASVYTGPFWNRSGTDPKLDP